MLRRIYGIETEYGITFSLRGQRRLSPDEVSRFLFRKVVAWGRSSNVFLENGSRLYLDVGSHPEYATAECDTLVDAVAQDKAGEAILRELVDYAQGQLADEGIRGEIFLFKNNTDSTGNSYGCHENYCIERIEDLSRLEQVFIPYLISRQIFTGAGKVVTNAKGTTYSMSQRAEHIWEAISSATTRSRPIINTRDEPHADPEKYRRLHVIVGDSNMSEFATYLKLGTASVVLAMIEDKFLGTDLSVEAPVAELRAISHDPTCRRLLTLKDGRKMTAVQLQAEYLELARKYTEDKYGNDVDDITSDVLNRWESVLNRLAEDPMLLSKELDWVAKLELLEGYRSRDGLAWDHPRLQLVDLQYSDVRPDRGLYNRLAARGRMVRLTDDATIERAVENPPEDTRAYFRGRCLRQYPESVAAASWDSVIFDIPGRESLQRVPTLEPLRGTKAHVGELLDRCRSAAELVAALTGHE